MTPLRVGLVGAGANTRDKHIPGLLACPGVELVAVANRSLSSSRKVAEAFGIARAYGDWREVVADAEVDAVCIGTWPYLHAEVTIAALAAGKHVLTEARLAMNLAEAQAMAAAAVAAPGLVAQVVPAPFSFGVDAVLAAAVAAGELGTLRLVEIRHDTSALVSPTAPRSWRQVRAYSGVNVLTLGILHEGLLRWLDRQPVKVTAHGTLFTPTRLDPETGAQAPVEYPDLLTVVGEFADGAALRYQLNAAAPGPTRLEAVLHGERGALRADLLARRLWFRGLDGTETERPIPAAMQASWNVEADFVASIRDGRPVTRTSFPEAVRYMAFTEAVDTSWRNGGTVQVVDVE